LRPEAAVAVAGGAADAVGGGGGNGGLGIGLGVGALIVGGAIAANAAEQQRQRDAIDYCMQRYRSYDPQSITYLSSTATAASVRNRRRRARRFQNPGLNIFEATMPSPLWSEQADLALGL
jgi:hypothetical protein